MEDYLIKSMKRTLGYHVSWEEDEGFVWEQWQAKKLREIRKFQRRNKSIVAVSRKKWSGTINAMLKHQFLEGGKKTDKEFRKAIDKGFKLFRTTPNNDWFAGENNKVKDLIKAINQDFDNASYAALRKMDDVYRQTIFKSAMFSSNGAMTIGQSIDMATKNFLEKGIDCIIYKNGAKVNIASYAAMATRTANKRAYLMGEGDRRKEWGISLVLVSQYSRCSPLCLPWQGKVYIDDVYSDGKLEDGDYPLLSTAIKGHLYHPNCRHTQSTFFEDISEVPEPLRSESGEQYEKAQEIANAKRQARKYERLALGSVNTENRNMYAAKEKEWSNRANELENQKSTLNTETLIDSKYIHSNEYHEKFNKLTGNEKVDKSIYKCSKKMLKHRSGTLYEDIYFIDKNTGKIIASSTNMNIECAVGYNKKIKKALKNNDMSQVIAIHNHPSGMPPSAGDFNSAFTNGYSKCFTIGHDGSIIEYSKGSRLIDINEYDTLLSIERLDNTEHDAQIKVLNSLKEKYGIDYKEVTHGKK